MTEDMAHLESGGVLVTPLGDLTLHRHDDILTFKLTASDGATSATHGISQFEFNRPRIDTLKMIIEHLTVSLARHQFTLWHDARS